MCTQIQALALAITVMRTMESSEVQVKIGLKLNG